MMCFEGKISVKAILQANRREVEEVWLDEKKKDKESAYIKRLCESLNVTVKLKKREEIDQVANGKTHGGVICFAGARHMQTLADSLHAPVPFLAVIEGIEDPFNLGYAFRTLYAAGCHGILLSSRDWRSVENVILKSSAGASEHMNWIACDDLAQAVISCKEAGLVLACAERKLAIDYYDMDFNQPLLLAIGGEMRGLSQPISAMSDQNIAVPYANDFRNALNASSAVAAISFEIVRQRR